jgi:hypothetical protein
MAPYLPISATRSVGSWQAHAVAARGTSKGELLLYVGPPMLLVAGVFLFGRGLPIGSKLLSVPFAGVFMLLQWLRRPRD